MSDFRDLLSKVCSHYDKGLVLKPLQQQCFEHVLEHGTDVVLNVPTGYGKSLVFHLLPWILQEKFGLEIPAVVLVVCPLNVIQKDQLSKLASKGISACRLDIHGKLATDSRLYEDDNASFQDLVHGKYSIIESHPEALLESSLGQKLLDESKFITKVKALVIDECHKIEQWKSFRGAFSRIRELQSFLPSVQNVALTATLTQDQLRSLPKEMGFINPTIIQETPDRPNIYLDLGLKESRMDVVTTYEQIYQPLCLDLKYDTEFPVTLVYMPIEYIGRAMRYCFKIFDLEDDTTIYDPSVKFCAMFSNQDMAVTKEFLKQFKEANPRLRLIFCTSAVGMGFDSPAITRVIHVVPPRRITDYFQEIGRAGRRGQDSNAILHFNKADLTLKDMEDTMKDYCTSSDCLREILLDHYGFKKNCLSPVGCKCCYNCAKNCLCSNCELL